MVNASKILTVSYGTFSCTLEGFDDSFDTMKAIAEYFRDLAADDRYFGAEPPTPDAEMLARIAEREIARRVEAHEAEGNIVLRAADAAALTGAETPAPQPAETPQAEAQTPEPEAPEPKAEEPALAEVTPEEPAAEADEPAEPVQEPVAEVEEPVEAMEEPVAEVEEEVEAEEPAETAEAPIEAVETPAAEAEEPVDAVEDLAEAAEEPAAEAEEPVEAVEVAPAEADDETDSVAAKLRRIRSVVAHTDQGYTAADYTEDEHAQDFVDTTAAEMEMALEQDDIVQEQALSEDSGEDDLEALLSRFDSDDSEDDRDEEPVAEATAPQADEEDTETADGSDLFEDTLAQLLADSMPETADAPEDIAEESEPEEPEATATPLRLAPEDAVEDRDETTEDTAGEEAEQPLLRARVVKMKRTEFEAAIAEGYIEEDDEGDDSLNVFDDASYDDSGDMGLSPEDEAELQRELAEVEAEMGFEDDEDYDEDYDDLDEDFSAEAETEEAATAEQPEPEAEEEPAPRGLRKLQRAEREGGDVNRMFDKTDTHLEEPESNRRRSVIQHLRAAVAATRAEKKAGAEMDRDVDDTPYRSDLAEVVRPRRPRTSGASRSARPTELRPAPLKLVAEQRVDDLAPREAVRPRRVSTTDLVADETPDDSLDGGFAEFADQMGASGLPELLEAAAAYLSDVEGRPQFSRPMLMGKLKEVKQDTFSREDGLRSFGQLLRDGKLQKLKGGRFTITDETDYRGEARNVG
ncbi:hypothetical protein [Roseovarius pacificus]|uniref:hypothetical protein n=1 Tax=Roseovarius pacificus TaxID=337701 RepID=UPI002A187EF6|nr:hypothetical protein [Roseovarius pacificus]